MPFRMNPALWMRSYGPPRGANFRVNVRMHSYEHTHTCAQASRPQCGSFNKPFSLTWNLLNDKELLFGSPKGEHSKETILRLEILINK